jgi:hypothetical protein
MSRLPDIDEAKLSPKQQQIYQAIMRSRDHMPFAVWLRKAELCENTLKLQEMFASRVKLERRLLKLMILVTGSSAHRAVRLVHTEPHGSSSVFRLRSSKPFASDCLSDAFA